MNLDILAKWIVKDDNLGRHILRKKSSKVLVPVALEVKTIVDKLVAWVSISQNAELNGNNHIKAAVGLAAPQIGENVAIFYVLDKAGMNHFEHVVINPEIIWKSKEIIYLPSGEGCISVDENHEGYVPRRRQIKVRFYDYYLKKIITKELSDYHAIVFQHEFDHLQGKLYYDEINKKNPFAIHKNWSECKHIDIKDNED